MDMWTERQLFEGEHRRHLMKESEGITQKTDMYKPQTQSTVWWWPEERWEWWKCEGRHKVEKWDICNGENNKLKYKIAIIKILKIVKREID